MEFVVNGKKFTDMAEAQAYEAELAKQAEAKKKAEAKKNVYKEVESKLDGIIVAALRFDKDLYDEDIDEMVYLVIKSSQDIPAGKLIEGYAEAIFGNQFAVDVNGVHTCFEIMPITKELDTFKSTIAKYVVERGLASCEHQAERIELDKGECICFIDADSILHKDAKYMRGCNHSCECDCDCESSAEELVDNIAHMIASYIFG